MKARGAHRYIARVLYFIPGRSYRVFIMKSRHEKELLCQSRALIQDL